MVIGITGGIGSGKSVVSRALRCNGFRVYDCDSKAKFLMANDPMVKRNLKERLGKEIYTPSGDLNKKLLGALLFGNAEIRNFVNSVVHRAVREDILKDINKELGDLFIESAIPVTGGLTEICEQIWLVEADEEERKRRVIKRDGLKEEEVTKRIEVQRKEFEDLKDKNVVVLPNDNRHPLLNKILFLTNKLNNLQTYIIKC